MPSVLSPGELTDYCPFLRPKTVLTASISAPRLELLDSLGGVISKASAAFIRNGSEVFLVTNWHNLSGIDPITGSALGAAIPHSVRVIGRRIIAQNAAGQSLNLQHTFELQLFDRNGPSWFEHPIYQRRVDVAACKVSEDLAVGVACANDAIATYPVALSAGDEIYVLGYPFGISGGVDYPIWKRGSIASEPFEDIDGLPKYWIDAASRKGMSGSPVIFRSHVHLSDDSQLSVGHTAQLFYGIYSGRMPEAGDRVSDPLAAQIGIVWKPTAVMEIVRTKKLAIL